MNRAKPWTLLSSVLRRALTSPSNSRQSLNSNLLLSHSRLSNPERSACVFLQNFRFPGKGLRSISSDEARVRCWSCGAAAFLFCDSCRSIQPVDRSVDYFQIFGWDRKYEIESDRLEGKYKDWQKKLHPDLVHSKSEEEREYAAEQSSRVIDAYRTLRSPLLRAIYILKLEGIDIDEEETISEPELLGEIMEIREAVEDAADSKELKQIQILMQEKLKHWANSFANAFQSRKFDEAVASIRRMKYYERVNEEIVKRL